MVVMSRLTEFDRETLSNVTDEDTGRHLYWVEGYWAQGKNPLCDWYKGRYPFPISSNDAWPGKDEFLDKLAKIERLAEEVDIMDFNPPAPNKVWRYIFRGLAPSRLDKSLLGCSEFSYRVGSDGKKINWTDAMGEHYVKKYNVKPSREFYEFVTNFAL